MVGFIEERDVNKMERINFIDSRKEVKDIFLMVLSQLNANKLPKDFHAGIDGKGTFEVNLTINGIEFPLFELIESLFKIEDEHLETRAKELLETKHSEFQSKMQDMLFDLENEFKRKLSEIFPNARRCGKDY